MDSTKLSFQKLLCFVIIYVDKSLNDEHLPYGGKLWRVEPLADLANDHKFAKVSSAKILCSILNNIINVQIRQSLFASCIFVANLPKFAPTKVSLYTVSHSVSQ